MSNLPIAPTTPAGYRRFVTDDGRFNRIQVIQPDRPYPDGEPWLSETHWIALARWFQPFFDYHDPRGRGASIAPGMWAGQRQAVGANLPRRPRRGGRGDDEARQRAQP